MVINYLVMTKSMTEDFIPLEVTDTFNISDNIVFSVIELSNVNKDTEVIFQYKKDGEIKFEVKVKINKNIEKTTRRAFSACSLLGYSNQFDVDGKWEVHAIVNNSIVGITQFKVFTPKTYDKSGRIVFKSVKQNYTEGGLV